MSNSFQDNKIYESRHLEVSFGNDNTTLLHDFSKITEVNESSLFEEYDMTKAASTFLSYKIGLYINTYYLPVIIAVGLLGNSLSFAVMIQKHNRQASCCVYMAALATSDNITLLSVVYFKIIQSRPSGFEGLPWHCKFGDFMFSTFAMCKHYYRDGHDR